MNELRMCIGTAPERSINVPVPGIPGLLVGSKERKWKIWHSDPKTTHHCPAGKVGLPSCPPVVPPAGLELGPIGCYIQQRSHTANSAR